MKNVHVGAEHGHPADFKITAMIMPRSIWSTLRRNLFLT